MKNVHEIKIKLTTEWEKCLDDAFKKKVKETKVDGFRKGTCPKDIFIKRFGIESLYMDAVDEAVAVGYKKALEDNKDINPVIEPKVDIKNISAKEIEFKFTIITKPEITLGDYKNLGIKKEEAKVSKKEIDEEINRQTYPLYQCGAFCLLRAADAAFTVGHFFPGRDLCYAGRLHR